MQDDSSTMAVFTPNAPRILAALYHVMSEASSRGFRVSQYDLVKTLFLADKAHLNQWGRPITYDNYCAMLHGPVPSLAYDFLKSNSKALRDYNVDYLPWKALDQGKSIKHYFPVDGVFEVESHLSPSDLEALNDALGTVKSLTFGQIRRLTHEDPAYLEAWQDNGGKASYEMKFGLFFDEPNFEQASVLAEYSPYV